MVPGAAIAKDDPMHNNQGQKRTNCVAYMVFLGFKTSAWKVYQVTVAVLCGIRENIQRQNLNQGARESNDEQKKCKDSLVTSRNGETFRLKKKRKQQAKAENRLRSKAVLRTFR